MSTRRKTWLGQAALAAAEAGHYVFPVQPGVIWLVKLSQLYGCRTSSAVAVALVMTMGARFSPSMVSSLRGVGWSPWPAAAARLAVGGSR